MGLMDFMGVRNTRAAARDRIQELQEEASTLRAEIAAVRDGNVAKSDLKAAINRWIDGCAASIDVNRLLIAPRDVIRGGELFEVRLAQATVQFGAAARAMRSETRSSRNEDDALTDQFRMLATLFPDQIRKRLQAAVDEAKWSEGLPEASRAAAIAGINQRLDAVNAEIEQLRAAAKEAGISL